MLTYLLKNARQRAETLDTDVNIARVEAVRSGRRGKEAP
jgi:hypothetical protein